MSDLEHYKKWNMNKVVISWSGGIDSTALLANLLHRGYEVTAIALDFYGKKFCRREHEARCNLMPFLSRLPGRYSFFRQDGSFLWNFSPDGKEIPRRNKHIMDYLITREMMHRKIFNLGMGEYVGADTWLVRDHVGSHDADARALETYLYIEYGIDYRLFTLRDFGESRYKSHRLKLGFDVLGNGMYHTTNCLENKLIHCGGCYKCIERAVAFSLVTADDPTKYEVDPKDHPSYDAYLKQMTGREVEAISHEGFKEGEHKPLQPEECMARSLWFFR